MLFKHMVDSEIQLVFLHESLAEDIFKLVDSDRTYLSKWLPWVNSTKSSDDTKHFIKDSISKYANGTMMTCVIEYQQNIVGLIGYNLIDQSLQKVEIGYWLSSRYQGNGIITRSCNFLIDNAFQNMQMDTVQISVAKNNRPSRKVCERLGLVLEGIISNSGKVNNQIHDHAIYSIKKKKT